MGEGFDAGEVDGESGVEEVGHLDAARFGDAAEHGAVAVEDPFAVAPADAEGVDLVAEEESFDVGAVIGVGEGEGGGVGPVRLDGDQPGGGGAAQAVNFDAGAQLVQCGHADPLAAEQ